MKKVNNIFRQGKYSAELAAISLIIAATLMLIIAMGFKLVSLKEGQAHESQELKLTKTTGGIQSPFSAILPSDEKKYTELLKPPRTVTMRSGFVRLDPGQDVGLHSTKQNEEMLVILEGQGEVELEGHPSLKISGGQVAYVPPMTTHNVRNTGIAPLKYIFIVSKAIDN